MEICKRRKEKEIIKMKTYIIEVDSEIDSIEIFKAKFYDKMITEYLKLWRIRIVEK